MHDQMVSRLLKMLEVRMPHVQRIMAVNRVPRKYDAIEIAEEMHRLYSGSQPSRVYMAYHFHGPERRERLTEVPLELREMQLRGTEVELPAFFRIDQRPVPQPPSSVPEEAWMLRLGGQLEGNVLLADAIDSSVTTLRVRLCNALQVGRGWVERSNERLDAAHRILADACLDFSVDPGSPVGSGNTVNSADTTPSVAADSRADCQVIGEDGSMVGKAWEVGAEACTSQQGIGWICHVVGEDAELDDRARECGGGMDPYKVSAR